MLKYDVTAMEEIVTVVVTHDLFYKQVSIANISIDQGSTSVLHMMKLYQGNSTVF